MEQPFLFDESYKSWLVHLQKVWSYQQLICYFVTSLTTLNHAIFTEPGFMESCYELQHRPPASPMKDLIDGRVYQRYCADAILEQSPWMSFMFSVDMFLSLHFCASGIHKFSNSLHGVRLWKTSRQKMWTLWLLRVELPPTERYAMLLAFILQLVLVLLTSPQDTKKKILSWVHCGLMLESQSWMYGWRTSLWTFECSI